MGDLVDVAPMKTRSLTGVIGSIDSNGLRQVLTADGHHYAAPDELLPPSGPLDTKATSALAPGDRIILMTGETGEVLSVTPKVRVVGPRSVWALSATPSAIWVMAEQ